MGTRLAVVARWINLLSGSALLFGEGAEEAAAAAALLVGEDELARLREHLATLSHDQVEELRTSAVEIAIWMAVADRVVDPRERRALVDLIDQAELPQEAAQRLQELSRQALGDVRRLSHLETLAERAEHPPLRELFLGIAWHVAIADGFVDDLERQSFERLSAIFGVDPPRADAIRAAVAALSRGGSASAS